MTNQLIRSADSSNSNRSSNPPPCLDGGHWRDRRYWRFRRHRNAGHQPGPQRRSNAQRSGFTLVELLVVIAIMGILVSLLLPAMQEVRESSRRVVCGNQMRQQALAVLNFESNRQHFPTSFDLMMGQLRRGAWSVHAKILPLLDQDNTFVEIDFSIDWHQQVATGVPRFGVPVFSCPSDFNAGDRPLRNGDGRVHSTSYGFNMGTWFIYDPTTGKRGNGAFTVGSPTQVPSLQDGLSNTLGGAEVKSFTSYVRNANGFSTETPTSVAHFQSIDGQMKLGPNLQNNTGHSVWTDGRVHHTGFTVTFTPNTAVPFRSNGLSYDIDFNSQQEGRDLRRATYAAVTARSWHNAGVNTFRMDGSVEFITDDIDPLVWRALGSRAGGESIIQ